MLKWEDYGIEIIGTARNGQQAADMIESERPDIVITDIKMPLKTGLELADECREKYGQIPLFIILTSFEEFDFARQALKVQAVDYLIKLELTPESLGAVLSKTLSQLEQIRGMEAAVPQSFKSNIQALREKFFMRLYNNLFESREQYEAQKKELGLDFTGAAYAVLAGEINPPSPGIDIPADEKGFTLYTSSVQMVRTILKKKHPCYVTMPDIRHFAIAFCLADTNPGICQKTLEEELRRIIAIIRNYFNVSIRMAFGRIAADPLVLDESYFSAWRLLRETSEDTPLLFFDGSSRQEGDEFDFSGLRPLIRRAFDELDVNSLHELITKITDHFQNHPELRFEAMDAACNVLYMALSFLPGGEETVSCIFSDDPERYRGIYRMHSTSAIMEWLVKFQDGCCEILASRRQNYRQQMVANVQEYIRHNLDKRLSLHEVAAVFNLSPNYLSQLFTKYAGEGFVEYITGGRINAAREMLAHNDRPVYEIAGKLGFESAFYFSKVFKKVTGLSPREFQHNLNNKEQT
jgi:two-component system response regulator YesN